MYTHISGTKRYQIWKAVVMTDAIATAL